MKDQPTKDQRPTTVLVALAAVGLLAVPVVAQPVGTLFPEPFVVEHQLIQTDADGSAFMGEPVTDYYGGSWIVSVRSDESRLVVDLARREVTEVRPDRGTFWTVGFDRLAELRSRLMAAELDAYPGSAEAFEKAAAAEPPPPPIVVSEPLALKAELKRPPEAARALVERSDVRYLRVEQEGLEAFGLDVWVDPRVRLTPAAATALERFEDDVLGPPAGVPGKSSLAPMSRYVAAARSHAGGAFPIRTVRPVQPWADAAGPIAPEVAARVTLEDVALRLERLAELPRELVTVPDGLKRVAHPLESAVAFAEKEAERIRVMGQSTREQN
jgi:hypothetical protein